MKILDAGLSEIATIKHALAAVRTEQINGDNILNFTIHVRSGLADYINETNVIELDEDYFDIAYYRKEQRADGLLMVNVECEHVSYRLNNYMVEYFTEHDTVENILGKILAGTDFNIDTVEVADTITFSLQESATKRMLLMQLAAYVEGELYFDGFDVSLLEQRGSAVPKELTIGKDITIVSKSVDKRELVNGNPTIAYTCGVYKGASLDLGDLVTLDYDALDIDVSLRVVSKSHDPYNANRVTVEIGNYVNSLEDDIYRIETSTLGKGKTYYGARISPEYGFESIRNDKLARGVFNADEFALQSGDGSGGNWTDRLYFDPINGAYIFDGTLSATAIEAISAELDITISHTVIVNNLYADKGYIADLTVDELDTSDKVQNYLASKKEDVDYIHIYDQYIKFLTAKYIDEDGSDKVHLKNRDGEYLYWIDDNFEGITTDVTVWPVYVYTYKDPETIKMSIGFENIDGVKTPVITLGAGDGVVGHPDYGKAYVYKDVNGLRLRYIAGSGSLVGTELDLYLNKNGIEVINNTGPRGIRNVHIGDAEPDDPQTNDLWIDTDA